LRIIIRADDARAAREAQAQLGAAGYAALALPGRFRPAPDGEDIAIVCGGALPLAQAARAAEPKPLAIVAALARAAPRAFVAEDGYDAALALDAPPALLAAQLEAIVRVATIEDEHRRRAATAAALAIPAPASLTPPGLKLLYVGAPGAAFLALQQAIAELGGSLAAAFTTHAGFEHLHDQVFDAVVLNGAREPGAALSLCAALRRNASLAHLPTLLLTAAGDAASGEAAIKRGAAATATLAEICGPELGWLFETIRRERRRRAGEHGLRTLRDLLGDPRTGLFRRAPFESHLARLADEHQRSGRPLALVALRVAPAFGAAQPSADAWRRGFGEIASLAGALMREADSGAVLGGDLIVLALPVAGFAAARALAERIAAVAECTAFVAGDNGAGPLVFERSAAELQPGESGAGLLARALRGIEAVSASA
jgi:two-component system, cell cycle response regulator PopA